MNDQAERTCTCHPWDNPPVPCAQRYALTECVQAAIRALEAKVREAESEHAGVVATLGKALRELSFAAQTTGGTAGRDEGLVAAIDGATQALSLIGVSRSIDLVSELRADRDRLAAENAKLRGFAREFFGRHWNIRSYATPDIRRLAAKHGLITDVDDAMPTDLVRSTQGRN